MWYRAIKRMIEQGRTDGLLQRVNMMYTVAQPQLTDEQYTELVGLLS